MYSHKKCPCIIHNLKKKIDLNNNDNSLHIFVEFVVPLSDNETPECVLINMEFFSR